MVLGVRQRVGGPTRVVQPTPTPTAAAASTFVPSTTASAFGQSGASSTSGAATYMLQATPNVVRTETVQTTPPNSTNPTTE